MEVNYFQVPRQFYSKSLQNSGYKTVKTVLKYTRKTFKNPGNPEGQSRVCGIEKSRENPGFPVPGKPGEKPYMRQLRMVVPEIILMGSHVVIRAEEFITVCQCDVS